MFRLSSVAQFLTDVGRTVVLFEGGPGVESVALCAGLAYCWFGVGRVFGSALGPLRLKCRLGGGDLGKWRTGCGSGLW